MTTNQKESSFIKLFNDQRAFYQSAKDSWKRADRLAKKRKKELKEEKAKHPNRITLQSLNHEIDSYMTRLESALTSATINYYTSLELLMKGFVGVDRQFSEESYGIMRKKIGHKITRVFNFIPLNWIDELEDIYQTTNMKNTEVAPFYSPLNTPDGEWICKTDRLDCQNLDEFLGMLYQEKMHVNRFSFEDFSEDDWRIKLCSCSEIQSFHSKLEELLRQKAKERNCLGESIKIMMNIDGFSKTSDLRLSPEAQFEINKSLKHRWQD